MRYEDWHARQSGESANDRAPEARSVPTSCASDCWHTMSERKRMRLEGLSHSQVMDWRLKAQLSANVSSERRIYGGQKDIVDVGCGHYWYGDDKLCVDCGDNGLLA